MYTKLQYAPPFQGRLWFHQSNNVSRVTHRHDDLECNVVISGTGTYLIQQQRVTMTRGAVLWLFPEQNHLLLDSSSDFKMWIFVLRPEFLQNLCETLSQKDEAHVLLEGNPRGSFLRFLSQEKIEVIHDLCLNIVTTEKFPAYYNAGIAYLLWSVWTIYSAAQVVPVKSTIHPAIEQVAQLIHQGSWEENLESLAEQVGMAPATISRLFKQQTGLSVTAFRNRCRMDRFFTIYDQDHQPNLMNAALEAGFGSYAQFYRVFTQMMGMTPAVFQQKNR